MFVGGGLQCDALVFDERFDKLCVALEAIRGIWQGDTTTRCTKKQKKNQRRTTGRQYHRNSKEKKEKANALALFVHKKQARALCRISTFTRGNDHVSIVPLRLWRELNRRPTVLHCRKDYVLVIPHPFGTVLECQSILWYRPKHHLYVYICIYIIHIYITNSVYSRYSCYSRY